ncbi:MAG: cation transporter [Prevotellaceae bacterium]|jgi:copper chaperone CopZ|nr:cation transporter [Prevotellaceae bacterium]
MKVFRLFVLLIAMSTFAAGLAAQDNKSDKAGKKKKTEEVTFSVNMTCDNCKAKIERHISWEKGVKDLKVNLDKKQVTVKYDPAKTTEDKLKEAINKLEFTCEKTEPEPAKSKPEK